MPVPLYIRNCLCLAFQIIFFVSLNSSIKMCCFLKNLCCSHLEVFKVFGCTNKYFSSNLGNFQLLFLQKIFSLSFPHPLRLLLQVSWYSWYLTDLWDSLYFVSFFSSNCKLLLIYLQVHWFSLWSPICWVPIVTFSVILFLNSRTPICLLKNIYIYIFSLFIDILYLVTIIILSFN